MHQMTVSDSENRKAIEDMVAESYWRINVPEYSDYDVFKDKFTNFIRKTFALLRN